MTWTLRPAAVLLPIVLAGTLDVSGAGAQALPPLDEYHVRTFDVDDGLLVADVRGLARTRDGYLYVGSARGLARFDGAGFHPVALPGFRSSVLGWLDRDRQDRVWLLSRENELGYVEHGRVHRLPDPPVRIGGLSQTADGTLWYGGFHGLVRVTPGADAPYARFTTAHGLPTDTVLGVYDLPDGTRVAATARRLARVEPDAASPGGLRFVPFGPECGRSQPTSHETVRLDGRGLWIGCPGGVLQYRAGRFARRTPGDDGLWLDAFDWSDGGDAYLPRAIAAQLDPPATDAAALGPGGHRFEAVLRGRDGAFWFVAWNATDGRSELLRGRAGILERVPLRQHLDFKQVLHLLEDPEGSLWVATERGLLQLSPRRVFALTRRHGLAEGFTVPVLQTRDGAVWVGTWGGGLHRFAGGRLAARYGTATGLPDDHVRALFEAADGTLWVGMTHALAAVRGGRIVVRERADGEVRSFAQTADGALWIGTTRRLLRRTAAGVVEHRPGFWRERPIWALHAARDGALWVGTERGLFRLVGDSVRAFDGADGLRGTFVASIHEEADGTLWFGTYEHGLHRWRGGRFAAVTTREGLHHDGVWRMLDDGRGGVWMSSDAGIFRVDHGRLHAAADAVERGGRPPRRLAPLVFTEAEGMPNRESNRASPGGWRLRDGRLVFNNLDGVVVIDPARAAEPRAPPPMVLQGIVADGDTMPLRPAGRAALPAGTKQLAFDFAALSFVAPTQSRYRYRLDGYDDDWVDGGARRRASYTNLPPGRYRFRVQGASAGSAWSEPGAAYAIVVRPFPWQTWTFRLVALAALAGLLAAAYRYRVAHLLAMQRLRLRIAGDLHDDVGSNLSSIALLSEMLQRAGREDEVERRQLARINRAAEETIGALRDIIWLVDPTHDDLADLVGRMRRVAGDLLNGTACAFEVALPAAARPLEMTFMRNALLIYKEALHNVVRHAQARRVVIELREERGLFVLRVEDDGVGFTEADVRPGRGLASMRRRAQQTDGRLEITSVPRAGTRVTYTVRMS